MFTSSGIIQHNDLSDPTPLRLLTDPDLSEYYRNFIPKYFPTLKPGYKPHISIVRKEIPLDLSSWGKYDGEEVEFQYNGCIHCNDKYFWINAFSYRLEEIRRELGLSMYEDSNFLIHYSFTWHITIGIRRN